MALFCIILIVIASVLEIKAIGPHMAVRCRRCKPTKRPVSKSPRQTFHPKKLQSMLLDWHRSGTAEHILDSWRWLARFPAKFIVGV